MTEADEGREGNDWARVMRTDLSLRGCGSVNNVKNRLAAQIQADGSSRSFIFSGRNVSSVIQVTSSVPADFRVPQKYVCIMTETGTPD